jgi:hypothetical protein
VATTAVLSTTSVEGKALYLEFTKPGANICFQLLAYPDAVREINQAVVRFGTYYRTLTKDTPKRPWSKSSASASRVVDHQGGGTKLEVPSDVLAQLAITDKYLSHISSILDQLDRQGFTVRKQPIIVEVSNVDVEAIAAEQTPYALFRRVMKSREALGFPEEFVGV